MPGTSGSVVGVVGSGSGSSGGVEVDDELALGVGDVDGVTLGVGDFDGVTLGDADLLGFLVFVDRWVGTS